MKKIVLSTICIISLLALFGCEKGTSNNNIEQYLNNKYKKDFTYVGPGDDVWSSKEETKIYADDSGNEFKVRNNNSYLTDNYYHIIYDEEISNIFRNELSLYYKVYVSTDNNYTTINAHYKNVNDYINDNSALNISVYTTNNDFSFIKERLSSTISSNNFNNYIVVVVYQVASETFNNITKYNTSIDVIDSETFSFNE